MSWCDKLASTPAAGFKLDWHFASASGITEAMAPILDQLVVDNRPRFSVSTVDQFNASIASEDGFTYGMDPSGINVVFQHRMKAKAVSAGPPVMELVSRPMPFTQLLPDVFDRLVRATLLLPNPNKIRRISRVGIVSTTIVAQDELPPGIAMYVRYMSRPWMSRSESFHFQITSALATDKKLASTDYCTHVVAKQDGPDNLVVLNFDWYRVFDVKRAINEASLQDILRKAKVSALEYFESLGEGSQFDEHIISDQSAA